MRHPGGARLAYRIYAGGSGEPCPIIQFRGAAVAMSNKRKVPRKAPTAGAWVLAAGAVGSVAVAALHGGARDAIAARPVIRTAILADSVTPASPPSGSTAAIPSASLAGVPAPGTAPWTPPAATPFPANVPLPPTAPDPLIKAVGVSGNV